ncbi:MAG TPA: DNA gyrase subunit A [Planctomycetota bacterium]|nr:DNA gyrase subunit A [Planctomycetota bacterium]
MDFPDLADGLTVRERRVLLAAGRLPHPRGALGPKTNHVLKALSEQDPSTSLDLHFLSLMRLTQDSVARYPLLDGAGPWGSLAVGPAAAPFTEIRLSAFGRRAVENAKSPREPFAGDFPHLLCNGAWAHTGRPDLVQGPYEDPVPAEWCPGTSVVPTGRVVGGRLLSWIPPHNLGEVCAGLGLLVDHPETSLDELMAVVPGPDFPTGGVLPQPEQIRAAYARGVGRLRLAPRVGPLGILELPYGMRVPEAVEALLYRRTVDRLEIGDGTPYLLKHRRRPPDELAAAVHGDLQVRMIVLKNGRPQTVTLLDLFHAFLEGLYRRSTGKRDRKGRVKAMLRRWKSRSDRRRTSIGA